MNASTYKPHASERRRGKRQRRSIQAFVHPRRARKRDRENAVVDEIGGGGIRITSGTPLKKDDSVIVEFANSPSTVAAKVVWVRKNGLIEKRKTGMPGQAFVAGCRLKSPEKKREKKSDPIAGDLKRVDLVAGEWSARAFGGLLVALGLGVLGLVAYLLISLVTMLVG